MSNEMTKTQSETKTPQIKASVQLWAEFKKWMAVHSCLTLPEGLRAAMRKVTNFDEACQVKNSPN